MTRGARSNRLNLGLKRQPLSVALLTHWVELLTQKFTYPELTLIDCERTPIKSTMRDDVRPQIILDHYWANYRYLNLKRSWETGYSLNVR